MPPSGPLREAALRLAPRPEQEELSGRADQTLPLAERDRPAPGRPATRLPAAWSVVLTVDVRNPAARAVSVRGGFVDADDLCLGGSAGPQHVHVLRLEHGTRGPDAGEAG